METRIGPCAIQDNLDSRESNLRERFRKQVRLEVELNPAKQEACAHDLKVDSSTISKWGTTADMPAWRLIEWTETYGPELLAWICRQAGGTFQGKQEDATDAHPIILAGRLGAHSGEVIQEVIEAGHARVELVRSLLKDAENMRQISEQFFHQKQRPA